MVRLVLLSLVKSLVSTASDECIWLAGWLTMKFCIAYLQTQHCGCMLFRISDRRENYLRNVRIFLNGLEIFIFSITVRGIMSARGYHRLAFYGKSHNLSANGLTSKEYS